MFYSHANRFRCDLARPLTRQLNFYLNQLNLNLMAPSVART